MFLKFFDILILALVIRYIHYVLQFLLNLILLYESFFKHLHYSCIQQLQRIMRLHKIYDERKKVGYA